LLIRLSILLILLKSRARLEVPAIIEVILTSLIKRLLQLIELLTSILFAVILDFTLRLLKLIISEFKELLI